ncbi:class I SAM-dependent methyltransferase [Pseudoalteromonas sp. T1lg23B]|uniref:class I SAM-dependent methyltransferase n=1 Tax=Pseudoalteromonas sp. T1lg23B TaxID=2077097 RepID=UPI000CF5E4F6|nr:class I SAM-dependent methyltransferase [Pseudoalteromonas sp. T1lg23B]
MEQFKCPLCQSLNTKLYLTTQTSVASDGQLVDMPIDAHWCNDCQTLSKSHLGCEASSHVIDSIYNRYTLHSVGTSQETKVLFNVHAGGITKSKYNYLKLKENIDIKSTGKLLDIGCHYGSFLQNFHDGFPFWHLYGVDVSDRFKSKVESISENTHFTTSPISKLAEKFDIIVVTHVLEHIADLPELLASLYNKLASNGVLHLQTNNLESNYFLPIIYEQYYNFTPNGLTNLLAGYGFEVMHLDTTTLPKEMTLICKKAEPKKFKPKQCEHALEENIRLLKKIDFQLKQYANSSMPLYILGTTYVARWLAANYGLNIVGYLDEDTSSLNQLIEGVAVMPPAEANKHIPVILPFPIEQAKQISQKLEHNFGLTSLVPPFSQELL